MATFDVVVSFFFDTDYRVEANSYEEAERLALEEAEEWKPYSSDKGWTEFWHDVQIESVTTDDELEEDSE
jgi:hypothetical protein